MHTIQNIKHRTAKYLNNLMEQNHRYIKRRLDISVGFQSPFHTLRTIKGIKTIMLYKQRRIFILKCSFSMQKELQSLFFHLKHLIYNSLYPYFVPILLYHLNV
ncbi:TPA: IS6 family transposase [Bacillus cereus]|nr:IS6 family transposase [Bacillus cereus]HDR3914492.1 IS6 family transposase [Bacillus cereus]HDV7172612.1 IS6 family transposase [Bacillus cereus]